MANVANLKQVTGLVLHTASDAPLAAAYTRTPTPQMIPGGGGGGSDDPVGPQRWPLRL